MDLRLTDRHVVVTGASSGLGLATAEVLAAEGARLTLVSRDAGRVGAAAERVGRGATGVAVDLTEHDAPDRVLAAATAAHGDVDGLFVSHGGPPAGPATDLDDDRLDAAWSLAGAAPIRLLRDVVGSMGPGGSAVVLTSTSSVQPITGLASSNTTRTAVWGYAKSLADEVGPRGVRVNLLLPGRFGTDRLAQLEAEVAARHGRTAADVRADSEAAVPLRRVGDPAELGRVAAFLLSPAASYVTGAAWAVDGGVVRGL